MKRILVATDFSTRSDRALRRAMLIARRRAASLSLVHVVDDDQPAELIEAQRRAAAELLDRIARTTCAEDDVPADVTVTTGDAFAAILQAAEEKDADLIVVGPHRRQLLDMFVGTTAERTIRRSRRPVLMANSLPSGPHARALLAVDLDAASRTAVEAARRLGLIDRIETIVLHLFDAPALGMMRRGLAPPEEIDQYLGGELRRARAELDAFLAGAGIEGVPTLLRPHGQSPASAILDCADEQEADLIVVGTNQRDGLRRFILGSVAQQVLLDARPDVLVVPHARPDAEAARR